MATIANNPVGTWASRSEGGGLTCPMARINVPAPCAVTDVNRAYRGDLSSSCTDAESSCRMSDINAVSCGSSTQIKKGERREIRECTRGRRRLHRS